MEATLNRYIPCGNGASEGRYFLDGEITRLGSGVGPGGR
jgi:hypothetical protein